MSIFNNNNCGNCASQSSNNCNNNCNDRCANFIPSYNKNYKADDLTKVAKLLACKGDDLNNGDTVYVVATDKQYRYRNGEFFEIQNTLASTALVLPTFTR